MTQNAERRRMTAPQLTEVPAYREHCDDEDRGKIGAALAIVTEILERRRWPQGVLWRIGEAAEALSGAIGQMSAVERRETSG